MSNRLQSVINFSQAVTEPILKSAKGGITELNTAQLADIRNNYLEIIELPDAKEQLQSVAEDIKNEYLKENNIEEQPPDDIELYIVDNGHSFSYTSDKQMILIGAKPWCDVRIGGMGVSRLHVVLFVLPDNKIAAVDVGSFNGVKTYFRSNEKPLVHSVQYNRNILIFDQNETFALSLYNTTVTCCPKKCIICADKPRDMRFNCGHLLCCAEDAQRVKDKFKSCPYCQKFITGWHKDLPFATNVRV